MNHRKLGITKIASAPAVVAASLFCVAPPVQAHHSYAMFDMSRPAVVQGSVAKLEWVNPHVFVWLYVEEPRVPGKYDLYAFESGPVNLLTRYGWTKNTLAVGEKIRVQYFPLKDGRAGGSFIRAIHADGRETIGDPFQPGVEAVVKKHLAADESPPSRSTESNQARRLP